MVADDPESFADLDGHEQNNPAQQAEENDTIPPAPGQTCGGEGFDCNKEADKTLAENNKTAEDEKTKTAEQTSEQKPEQKPEPPQEPDPNKPPSWDPKKPLPDNPDKLGPDWKPDPQHDPGGRSGDKRYVNPNGDKLDWHKGKPGGGKKWEDRDHWHWIPGGKKEKWHYNPGDTIKTYGPAIVKTAVVAVVIMRVIQVLEALGALAAL